MGATRKIKVGSCFSGIGGLELGLEWTGKFEIRWQIENDEYATKILEKNWPNVKRYRDIRDVIQPEKVDLVCGGFPCQDVSIAGKRKGINGNRSTLWGEMFRIVCEIRPRWVLAENVPGLLSSDKGVFFGNILRDLASIGYDVEWGILSAAGMGAPHIRKRLFLLANTKSGRFLSRSSINRENEKKDGRAGINKRRYSEARSSWWAVEPEMGRVAYGVPNRVDRIRCLGNAVVPQVAQKIGEMILNFEEDQNGKI